LKREREIVRGYDVRNRKAVLEGNKPRIIDQTGLNSERDHGRNFCRLDETGTKAEITVRNWNWNWN